ncbi:MAG: ATP-binding protein [Planctomycetota bacterium]
MTLRAIPWNWLTVGGLVVTVASVLALLVTTRDTARPEVVVQTRRLAALAGGAAIIGALALWAQSSARRRSVRRLVQTMRRLSSGEPVEVEDAGVAELWPLTKALWTLRQRTQDRFAFVDGQRRTLEALLDRLQEGILVADADGRIVLVNATAARLLNLPAAASEPERERAGRERAGRTPWIGRPVEVCVPQHALQQLLAPGAGPPAGRSSAERAGGPIRLEVERREGSVHLVVLAEDIALPARGVAVSGSGRVVMLADVTALDRLAQMKTDFVANASHELRTPLATIRAAVETLLSLNLQADAAAARDFLGTIDRHSARLEMLVKDLLDLSRLETPTTRFAPEPVDAAHLFEDLRSRFAERLERKRLRWEAMLGAGCGETRDGPAARPLVANPLLLRLVLDNLVDNAVKFTDPGGSVRVELSRTDAEAVFAVRDTGCGIPPDDQERVFERFYQVERARSGSERGTGLGLSIVRHAVSAMGGSVRLESTVGVGTTVTVRIPLPAS